MDKFNKIAYLISQYPAVSHTFIMREIRYLRNHGFDIHVASINSPFFSKNPTQEELQEASRTYCVKKTGLFHIMSSIIKTMILHPIGFWKGLIFAIYLN